MECAAVESVEVVHVATPDALRATGADERGAAEEVTLPAGVPPVEVTVAVKVTDCPRPDGLSEDASAVDVEAMTFCASALEVLAWKLPLPAYAAVIECDAVESDEVENVATPDALSAT